MSVTGSIVLFVTIWFMMMFIILPIRARSQADEGEVVPGTHEGAPANFKVKRTLLIVTLWTIPIWAVTYGIIISGLITVDDLDWYGVLGERIPN